MEVYKSDCLNINTPIHHYLYGAETIGASPYHTVPLFKSQFAND